MSRHLIISTSIDLVRVSPESIVYLSSDGNYSNLYLTDKSSHLLSFQLGQVEKMIAQQLKEEGRVFIRIGKSLIINRNFIHYINIPRQQLVLSDACHFSYELTASREALKQLKELIENARY